MLKESDLRKFRSAIHYFYMGKDDSQIPTLFSICDSNNNGTIEKEELRLLMSQFYEESIPDEEVEEMLEEADSNKDGVIQLDEFFDVMKAHREGSSK